MSEKAKYMLIGAALVLAVVVFLSAGPPGSVGTYQVAAGGTFYVIIDTTTGQVVANQCGGCVPSPGPVQLQQQYPGGYSITPVTPGQQH